MIKPDGVRNGLVGTILSRFENKGLKISKLIMKKLTEKEAREFYKVHKDKSFFIDLIQFITSGPVVVTILEGRSAVEVVRRMIGNTISHEAASGTIRGDFGLDITENIIHASDSKNSFQVESEVIFSV